jgi:hypothetical protein
MYLPDVASHSVILLPPLNYIIKHGIVQLRVQHKYSQIKDFYGLLLLSLRKTFNINFPAHAWYDNTYLFYYLFIYNFTIFYNYEIEMKNRTSEVQYRH